MNQTKKTVITLRGKWRIQNRRRGEKYFEENSSKRRSKTQPKETNYF
jgi:hypothetical protein